MKKLILTAVLTIAISGFAAAQSTSSNQAAKQEKATVKKGPATKTNNKSTVLKQETSANAKTDSTVRLVLVPPIAVDTSAALPKVKNEEF